MKPDIVIFATSYLPLVGGAQLAVHEITRRCPHLHFVVFCCRLQRALPPVEQAANITIRRIGIGLGIDRFLLPLLGPFAALRHGRGAQTIWGVMAQYGGMGALAYHTLTARRKRFVLTLQEGGEPRDMERKAGMLLGCMKMVVRNADTLQTISHALLDWGRDLGFRGSSFHVIPNGVDIARFSTPPPPDRLSAVRRRWSLADSDRVLCTASRLEIKNGILYAIEALAFLERRYRFVIAGEGRQMGEARALVDRLKLTERVILCGSLTTEEVVELLHVGHLFIRPSLSEGLGNAFLEAMAAGTPVIGTLAGGIADFLAPGETGLAVPPADPASIARAVREYEDPLLYNRIRENGRRMVAERFTWNDIAVRMGKVLTA